ncbi:MULTISPECIES: fibronectin type III-like domain-contianing protein [Arthrobacter]|uniref:Fibronectin type III-like domain-containing protein n=1 Tax=Arthrobacter terricola TaxID=2547396 RepID=A0A4R5L2K2_9MICC|nr:MULTISPECIES: fibronectin type III-like domain-contianing protein [Arthrobacter]MBT8158933.1 fibronectin type III-like domain-contianing protein [Arthrobacter sp. GN70]TDG01822.1 hypothetical protein E1809_00510 [Arthrobacter terricola]
MPSVLSRLTSAIERPAAWLAGFAKIFLEAGCTQRIEIPISRRAYEHWNASRQSWEIENGAFLVQVGSSIADVQAAGTVVQ